ncbi:hypothetical protein [Streptomyces sp. NPDC018833]|uniref:hypothetical protein n=1 Tax=Streptomyces sp. NPDC018833 TaxID=3365053 RepID=UPI00379D09EE
MASAASAAVLLLGTIAGCSSSGEPARADSTPKGTASPKAPPSMSAEDKAKEQVLAAYRGLSAVRSEAYSTGKVDNAKLQEYARDKAASGVVVAVAWYEKRGLKVVGKPQLAPEVTAVNLEAKPRTAVLSDCLDTSKSDTVYKTTGKSAIKKDSKEPRRKPVTAKAVTVGDRWLISEYEIDRSRSC